MNLTNRKIIKIFNLLNAIIVISFLAFILLVSFEKTNPVYGYLYGYVFFPMLLLLFIIFILFFLNKKDFLTIRKLSIGFGKWLIILIVFYAIIFFTK